MLTQAARERGHLTYVLHILAMPMQPTQIPLYIGNAYLDICMGKLCLLKPKQALLDDALVLLLIEKHRRVDIRCVQTL